MLLLRWLWIGNGQDGEIPPIAVFWTLRVLMFLISFVLEDWALHELISSPRHRRMAVLLVASSYVTWTYQTHTFSNAVETLVVAWSLVLIERIVDTRVRLPPGVCRSGLSKLSSFWLTQSPSNKRRFFRPVSSALLACSVYSTVSHSRRFC
jgi:hypothetical protein